MSLEQITRDYKIVPIGKNRYLANKNLPNKRCNNCDIALHCSQYKGKHIYLVSPINAKSARLTSMQKMFCVNCAVSGKYHSSLVKDDIIEHLEIFVGG